MANILMAGGGTAGHVNPLLSTADELLARGHDVLVLGTAEGLENELVPRAGLELLHIPKVPFPRGLSREAVTFPRRFLGAVKAVRTILSDRSVDAVVGFGGYVSTPAYRAARGRVPIVVHEANAKPGLANRWGARWAARVCTTFPGTDLPKAQITGLPLRPEIRALAEQLSDPEVRDHVRGQARATLGIDSDATVLLATGGSLGAQRLNDAVSGAADALVRHGTWVYHLTGAGKAERANRARSKLPTELRSHYRVEEYTHAMDVALAAADAVLCRAGAATVSEVTALGIPAVYVPLPHGNGEQAFNVTHALTSGAAVSIHDADVTPATVELRAEPLLYDRDMARAMRSAALSIAILDGAQRVADAVESTL